MSQPKFRFQQEIHLGYNQTEHGKAATNTSHNQLHLERINHSVVANAVQYCVCSCCSFVSQMVQI